jgi:hypothetical protein
MVIKLCYNYPYDISMLIDQWTTAVSWLNRS